jgi:hypothetical protein
MSERRKMTKSLMRAYMFDAMGGGLCAKHGEYLGYGKHHLADCPFCDIDRYFGLTPIPNDFFNSRMVPSNCVEAK